MQTSMVNGKEVQAQNRLFIIGNGFDLAHSLPTRFDPDFKDVAIKNESDSNFWDLYQSDEADIWSDFERLLAHPDFDELSQIFEAYSPDYSSDHESDRDSIILQANMSGKLKESLSVFAENAENILASAKPQSLYEKLLTPDSYYVSFNYTHTLEKLYAIPSKLVLHIHGEINGGSDLILGYDAGEFDEGIITEDVRMRGRGPYRSTPTSEYIKNIEDYYVRTAYESLLSTVQSWNKPLQNNELSAFLSGRTINEVVVIGFSFGKVDAAYFHLLQKLYPECRFIVTSHNVDCQTKYKTNIDEWYQLKNYTMALL